MSLGGVKGGLLVMLALGSSQKWQQLCVSPAL